MVGEFNKNLYKCDNLFTGFDISKSQVVSTEVIVSLPTFSIFFKVVYLLTSEVLWSGRSQIFP